MTPIHTQRPKVLQAVTPAFDWDLAKIRELDIPVQMMDIDQLLWHFDLPFWDKEGTDDWNLTPWEVLRDPLQEPSHYQKIWRSDLRYPLDVVLWKNRYRILDGLHRLAKAYIAGAKAVPVRIIPPEMFERIKK